MPFRKVFFNFQPQSIQASNPCLSFKQSTVYCRNELTCFWRLRSMGGCQSVSSPVTHSRQELCQWFQMSVFPWGWDLLTCTVAMRTKIINLTSHMDALDYWKVRWVILDWWVGFDEQIWALNFSVKAWIRGTSHRSMVTSQMLLLSHVTTIRAPPWPVLNLPALMFHGIRKVTKPLCYTIESCCRSSFITIWE